MFLNFFSNFIFHKKIFLFFTNFFLNFFFLPNLFSKIFYFQIFFVQIFFFIFFVQIFFVQFFCFKNVTNPGSRITSQMFGPKKWSPEQPFICLDNTKYFPASVQVDHFLFFSWEVEEKDLLVSQSILQLFFFRW